MGLKEEILLCDASSSVRSSLDGMKPVVGRLEASKAEDWAAKTLLLVFSREATLLTVPHEGFR